MKKFLLTSVSVALLATPVLAGSPALQVAYEPEVAIAAPQAADWGGFYAGGLVSFADTEFQYHNYLGSNFYDPYSGTQFGGFAGYNFQRGDMVFGVEAAYSIGDVQRPNDSDYAFKSFVDVKGRFGYAMGDALLYAVAGESWAKYDYDTEPMDLKGFNYGVGIDYHVTDRLFVGGEYLVRKIHEDRGAGSYWDAPVQAVELRVGMTF